MARGKARFSFDPPTRRFDGKTFTKRSSAATKAKARARAAVLKQRSPTLNKHTRVIKTTRKDGGDPYIIYVSKG